MPADITLVNLNLPFMRYGDQIERELHVPLGCLYLTRGMEAAGFEVDFRDYQLADADEPFDLQTFLAFLAGLVRARRHGLAPGERPRCGAGSSRS